MKQTRRHTFEILHGAGLAVVLRGMGAVLAFLLNIAIARIIGAEGAGFYFLALSVVSIGAVAAKLGLDNVLLRFVADGASRGDWNSVIGVFRLGTRIAALSTLLTGIGVFALAPWIATALFGEPGLETPLRAISLGIFSFAMMMQMAECLKALNRIPDSMLVSGIISPVTALVLIFPLAKMFGAAGASVAYVAGTLAASAAGGAMWRLATRAHAAPAPRFEAKRLWRSARPLWVMELINRAILPWAPLFLLGVWGTAVESGLFGAATRVAMLVSFFLVAVNTAVAPKFASLFASGEIRLIEKIATRFALIIGLISSPFLLLLIFWGDRVMGLFGPEFARGGAVLSILALGQAVVALTGVYGQFLIMSGHVKYMRNGSFIALIVICLGSGFLIPSLGAIGAAITNALAWSMMSLYLMGACILIFRAHRHDE